MNVLVGPLFDVIGYAFAPAAVLAPFSGFTIVTGFEKDPGELHRKDCFFVEYKVVPHS